MQCVEKYGSYEEAAGTSQWFLWRVARHVSGETMARGQR